MTNLIKFTYNLSLNCCSCKLTKILLRFACHCFDFAFFFWSKIIIKIGGDTGCLPEVGAKVTVGRWRHQMAGRFGAPIFCCLEPSGHDRSCCWMAEEVFAGPFFLKGMTGGMAGLHCSTMLNEFVAVVVVIHILLVKNGKLNERMFCKVGF